MGHKTYNLVGADLSTGTAGTADEKLISSSPSMLYSVIAYNDTLGDEFLQIHDLSAFAVGGEVPLISEKAATQTSVQIHFPLGRPMSNGIYVCWSSTDTTQTLTGTEGLIDVVWRVI